MHDANHGAYSSKPKVNDFLGICIYIIGGDVYNWKVQHNIFHHTYTNIDGLDGDLVAGDDIYSFIIPFSSSGDYVQYYIRAGNSEGVSLSPEKAEFEFYVYTVNYEILTSDIVINEIMAANDNAVADEFGEFDVCSSTFFSCLKS